MRQAAVYSLSLLLLKLAAPGVPDIYQGAELWEESFVDPDNRRPVDFPRRRTLLCELRTAETQSSETLFDFLRTHEEEGIGKLFTLYRTLACRNTYPELFSEGRYIPLVCTGPWLAFLRHQGNHWVLVAVPLVRYGVTSVQPLSLELPADAPTRWVNRFTGQAVDATRDSRASTLSWPDGPGGWPVILLTNS